MKILKILGIAAAVHALALLLIFANPGCSSTKAAATDSPISSAPTPTPSSATVTAPDSVGIRYSPTRPGTPVASALETAPVSGVTPATTYTVARGDSLYSIAKKNQLTKAELAAANNLKPAAALHQGQKLIIPSKAPAPAAPPLPGPTATAPIAAAPVTPAEKPPMTEATKHVVKPGETLGGIARRYGVKQGEIAVANNITDPKKIQPGQELIIPAHALSGKSPKAGSAAAPAAARTLPPPAADQDLDAGLKPATDVPVVKIEDGSAPAPAPSKNP